MFERLHAPCEINEQRRDDFYAFVVMCFHLKDWLKNDPLVSKSVGKKAEKLVNDERPRAAWGGVMTASREIPPDRPVQQQLRSLFRRWGATARAYDRELEASWKHDDKMLIWLLGLMGAALFALPSVLSVCARRPVLWLVALPWVVGVLVGAAGGLLIHAAVGSGGGTGTPRGKRSGCAA